MKIVKLLIPMLLLAAVAGAQTKPAPKGKQPAAKPAVVPAQTVAPAAGTPTDDFYEYMILKHTDTPAPEGYGLKSDMLIPVGAYVGNIGDEKKIGQQLNRFFKSLLWADGSQITWISRNTSMINGVNVEQFRVTKTGTKDTVTLYVDEYKAEPIQLPKGFKFYEKQQMLTDFAPVLDDIHKYNATPDKFGDAAAKAQSFKILGYLQGDVGLDYLLDKDMLDPMINEVSIDLDLKAFLIRAYLFYKFEYEITGQQNPKVAAFNAMVDDYQVVMKTHNILLKGNLATYMVKK
ncbi:hypothetical protein HQ865_22570 [Mucilaginibacter mali]|uniref:Uncharacterized protein n=1 Tax=Mucilaginibacter mali TaxID=2740462 RepID=A0A7D4PWG4_9SPHI|nr:hypothetical protein [Mucilaginibacter mali]QKJ32428.1 hypothetical protein HQ865_22570 [Mucilaginibacter mali]